MCLWICYWICPWIALQICLMDLPLGCWRVTVAEEQSVLLNVAQSPSVSPCLSQSLSILLNPPHSCFVLKCPPLSSNVLRSAVGLGWSPCWPSKLARLNTWPPQSPVIMLNSEADCTVWLSEVEESEWADAFEASNWSKAAKKCWFKLILASTKSSRTTYQSQSLGF